MKVPVRGSHSELAGDKRDWYRNLSPFKQTLKTSPHKPSASYTRSVWKMIGLVQWSRWQTVEQKPGAQQTTNSATQLYFCVNNFLNIIKSFLETSVQDKHEDFIKISELITALLLAVAPISPLAAEICGPRLTALYPIHVIARCDFNLSFNAYVVFVSSRSTCCRRWYSHLTSPSDADLPRASCWHLPRHLWWCPTSEQVVATRFILEDANTNSGYKTPNNEVLLFRLYQNILLVNIY